MKYILICLAVLLPFITTQAELTGEVIFLHPESDDNELWQTDTWDTRNAHRIFKHTQGIDKLAVQKDGPYLLIISVTTGKKPGFDAYLIDRSRQRAKARNLTWQRYDSIWDIDISHNGDVVFVNTPTGREPAPLYGIYLIRREELANEFPKAMLLVKRDDVIHARWAPDGVHIAYDIMGGGIYLYNTIRRGPSKGITKEGYFPAFSPDGNNLALVHKLLAEGVAISTISLEPPRRRLKTLALEDNSYVLDLKWAPDGQSLMYTVRGPDPFFHNYMAPLDGGPHEEILVIDGKGFPMFDWTNITYAVEPVNRLTTLWGKLKQRDLK